MYKIYASLWNSYITAIDSSFHQWSYCSFCELYPVLSVRFEVGVSILLAPARADKRDTKAPFPLAQNAGMQLAIHKRVPTGALAGAGSYWKHCTPCTFHSWQLFLWPTSCFYVLFFFQKGIHLSIIAPRKIPALQRAFERVRISGVTIITCIFFNIQFGVICKWKCLNY